MKEFNITVNLDSIIDIKKYDIEEMSLTGN